MLEGVPVRIGTSPIQCNTRVPHLRNPSFLGCATTAKPAVWQSLKRNASNVRFTWEEAVSRYVQELYEPLL